MSTLINRENSGRKADRRRGKVHIYEGSGGDGGPHGERLGAGPRDEPSLPADLIWASSLLNCETIRLPRVSRPGSGGVRTAIANESEPQR